MANHVSGYLSIRTISEEGQKVWDKIVSDLEAKRSEGEYEVHLGNYIFEDFDEDWDFNHRMCEEIGAKWAYATDMGRVWNGNVFCLVSLRRVCRRRRHEDWWSWRSVQIVLTYEDEMPNFVGVATFNVDGHSIWHRTRVRRTVGNVQETETKNLLLCGTKMTKNGPTKMQAWDILSRDPVGCHPRMAIKQRRVVKWNLINGNRSAHTGADWSKRSATLHCRRCGSISLSHYGAVLWQVERGRHSQVERTRSVRKRQIVSLIWLTQRGTAVHQIMEDYILDQEPITKPMPIHLAQLQSDWRSGSTHMWVMSNWSRDNCSLTNSRLLAQLTWLPSGMERWQS